MATTMARMRTLTAVLVSLMVAAVASAQTVAEFGRAAGDAITAITKSPRQTSGSLGLIQSSGMFRGRGYEATLGGELLNESVSYFAAASMMPRTQFTTEIPAYHVKATAQPLDWTTINASLLQRPAFASTERSLSTSFLSLRSTSILSERMTLDFHFSQQR